MINILEFLQSILPNLTAIVLFIIFVIVIFRSKGAPEILASFLLVALFVFYYSDILALWGHELDKWLYSLFGFYIGFPKLLEPYHEFVLRLIPESKGFLIGQKQYFAAIKDPSFKPTTAPILVLFGGILVRIVIERYVRNEKVQRLAREYWLFITCYFVAAVMINSITHLNFIWMIIIPLILLFFFSAGVFRVISDLLKATWSLLILGKDYIKLAMKYLAFIGAKFAKFLRKVVKIIVDFYNNYIVNPIRRLYHKLQEIRQKAEAAVDRWLDALSIDD